MRRVITPALFLLLLAAPLTALAWGSFSAFQEEELGFAFSGVELQSPNAGAKRCVVTATLTYAVPEKEAESHRFTAAITTSGGHTLRTTFTASAKSGRAAHRFSVDTGPAGCWAAQMQKPTSLKIAGCKGQRCTPE